MYIHDIFRMTEVWYADISPNVSQNQDNPQKIACIYFCDLSCPQFQMTQILLILYTKFHLFSMKNKKDIAFDITPFEKSQTNIHITCLVMAP